jgi:hypothetical protein
VSRGPTTWGWARTLLVVVGIGTAGAALVGGATVPLVLPLLRDLGTGVNADGSIDGVVTYEVTTNLHVDEPVDYPQTPPVGGEHLSVWQDCGFYDRAVVPEAAVHSLEHGAVWVTYDPDLPGDQVDRLEALAGENPYLLVSPVRGLPTPVVASAWGLQLRVDSVGDERLEAFLVSYQQGPQNPEPGAPCSGGLSEPAPPQPRA